MDDGAVGGPHHAFGLAVEIPVIGGDVDFVVLEVTHVPAAVDPPQFLARQLVGLDDGVGVVACIGMVELHNQFGLAVAVKVGGCRIVGHERAGQLAMVGLDFEPRIG